VKITIKKIIAIIAIATTVTGCGSGQMAQTRLIKQVTDGVEGQSDEVRLRNVKVIKTTTGQGVLIGTLVNWSDQADAITSISINNQPAIYTAKASDLIKNKPITFVGQIANADAYIPVLDKSAGYRIPVTFTFARAAPLTLDTLIVNGDGIYEVLERYTQITTTVEPNPQPSNL
jgi:DnaJ-class molecular chaperone